MRVTVITDGSYCADYKVGGYGFWIVCERGRWGSGAAFKDPCPSSGAAEMMAVVNTLYQGLRVGLIMKGDEVLIQTDCRGAIQAFERSIAWTNQPQRLAGMPYHKISAAFNKIRVKMELTVRFKHVKGHTNIQEPRYAANRKCDERAKNAMRQARAKAKEYRSNALDKA